MNLGSWSIERVALMLRYLPQRFFGRVAYTSFSRRFDIHTSLATSDLGRRFIWLTPVWCKATVYWSRRAVLVWRCLCVFRSRHADVSLGSHMRETRQSVLSGVHWVGACGLGVWNNVVVGIPNHTVTSIENQHEVSNSQRTCANLVEEWTLQFSDITRTVGLIGMRLWQVMPELEAELSPKLINLAYYLFYWAIYIEC